jgi:general secretion pathway protein K
MNSHMGSSEKGMVLVLTLAILVLITAMVTEFSYGVYIATSALSNWKDSQRLSFIVKSGITLAVKTISDIPDEQLFRFPGRLEIPVEKSVEGFEGGLVIEVEDENGKFNLNSIRSTKVCDSFRRLLNNLELDAVIADRVLDWIDTDNVPNKGFLDSEEGAKNGFFDSTDELLCIKGIDSKTYEKLLPYVTVYGVRGEPNDARININTAPVPVIMSLDPGITKELAERVVEYRKLNPFKAPGELTKVGFDGALINSMSDMIITDTASAGAFNFRIRSIAEESRIKRVIETVVEKRGRTVGVKYWKEY